MKAFLKGVLLSAVTMGGALAVAVITDDMREKKVSVDEIDPEAMDEEGLAEADEAPKSVFESTKSKVKEVGEKVVEKTKKAVKKTLNYISEHEEEFETAKTGISFATGLLGLLVGLKKFYDSFKKKEELPYDAALRVCREAFRKEWANEAINKGGPISYTNPDNGKMVTLFENISEDKTA